MTDLNPVAGRPPNDHGGPGGGVLVTPDFIDTATLDELDAVADRDHRGSAFITIGGAHAVTAVVTEFYTRMLTDPTMRGYFLPLMADGGLARLKRHQVYLLTSVLGGPTRPHGRDLKAAHADLHIPQAAMDRTVLYLLTVLHDFHIPMDILAAAYLTLQSVNGLIVSDDPYPTPPADPAGE